MRHLPASMSLCQFSSLLLLFAIPAVLSPAPLTLRGEVVCSHCGDLSDLSIQVLEAGSHVPAGKAVIARDGSFDLLNLEAGQYILNVETRSGDVVHSEVISTHTMSALSLRIPERSGNDHKPGTGTVSVAQLRHVPDKRALKAYRSATRAIEEGEAEHSFELLQRAVHFDPEWMEAWNNLGSRALQLGRKEEALEAFRKAASLDTHAESVYVNLGIACLHKKLWDEGETAVRHALELDAASTNAHYVLGMILYAQQRFSTEAIDHLDRAAGEHPHSSLLLGVIYAKQGKRDLAKERLHSYLKSPHPERRAEAERLLAGL